MERRVFYELETDESNKETGKLVKKIVRVRKEGKYEIIVVKPLIEQIAEVIDELEKVNEETLYKDLMYWFGFSESLARSIANKFLDGSWLESYINESSSLS
ncbi:MAG: hypothetical protein KBA47_00555 [Caldisericia bacterium]|nr:hypothetical protein [Caldisericia bacterium]